MYYQFTTVRQFWITKIFGFRGPALFYWIIKVPENIHFFRKKSPFFYCNGVSVVFPKPKSGLSRRSGLITSRARFLVGDRPETGSKLIINGKWTLGVFPIEEKSSPERIWNIFKTNSRFVLFMLNLSSWIIQTNPYNFTNLTKKGNFRLKS